MKPQMSMLPVRDRRGGCDRRSTLIMVVCAPQRFCDGFREHTMGTGPVINFNKMLRQGTRADHGFSQHCLARDAGRSIGGGRDQSAPTAEPWSRLTGPRKD